LIAMKVTLEKSDTLDRGERLIRVDGVVWGRTIVSSHGVHGKKHMFHQEHGETIGDVSKSGHFHEVCVRSTKRKSWPVDDKESKPTFELVLEKAIELINAGRLRHPESVKQEQERFRAQYHEREVKRAKAEQDLFETKAREALDGIPDDIAAPVLDKVIAAMRWAQTQ
jgi:hypothetical protein